MPRTESCFEYQFIQEGSVDLRKVIITFIYSKVSRIWQLRLILISLF